MGKRTQMYILIALTCCALLSTFMSSSAAQAQTATNSTFTGFSTTSTSRILNYSSISEPNTNVTSQSSNSSTSSSSSFIATESFTSVSSETNTQTSTATAPPSLSRTSTTTESTTLATTSNDSVTVTVTSTTTSQVAIATTTWVTDNAAYSISFSPQYWFCNGISVTFTGPLIESGLYGDTLQFEYFQYNPTYPSVLVPLFTDSGLTVTSDTVNYWITPAEYTQTNFEYLPNLAVKVIDLTPGSNGYAPGLIFMQLTEITPQGGQYCQYDSAPIPAPEFPTTGSELLLILASMGLSLAFLRVRRHRN